jgi:hypothetical protein
MLPDFPKTKVEISKLLTARVRNKTLAMSPITSLPRSFIQHEGDLHSYPQEGFGTVTEGFEKFEVPVTVKIDELPGLVGDRLLEKMDSIAEEMARKTSAHGYRVIDQVTEKAGTHLDAGGKPFDQEMYLAMLEKIDMSFNSDQKPDLVIVARPEMAKAIQESWSIWEKDPTFMKRYKEIMMLKREVWLDRESDRKLVD